MAERKRICSRQCTGQRRPSKRDLFTRVGAAGAVRGEGIFSFIFATAWRRHILANESSGTLRGFVLRHT